MFSYSDFNNDSLKNWNVSSVKYMDYVFENSLFNGKIKKWDVSNVISMQYMFYESKFNRNISIWNISNCLTMDSMFDYTQYSKDLSNWIFNENVYKNWIVENNTYKKMDIEKIFEQNTRNYYKEKEKNYNLNEILPNNNEKTLNINESFEIFQKQLKGFSSNSIISGKNLYIDNNKIYLKLFEHKTENRFYNEFVQYKKEYLTNFLNRNVIYNGSKSVLLGMELEFEIKYNEKIDKNIKTLNGEILYNNQLETHNFYTNDSIIIEVIRQLTLNNKIGNFILNNNELYLNNELLLTINYLKKSSYESNRSGNNTIYDSFNYNIVLNKNLYEILNNIKEEYQKEHNGYNLEYSSVGSENTNWVIKDLDLNECKHFNNWEENLSINNLDINIDINSFDR